jgi:putative N-acetyltransferase (TIGR04045 family)
MTESANLPGDVLDDAVLALPRYDNDSGAESDAGRPRAGRFGEYRIEEAADAATMASYRALRLQVFVAEQGLFVGHDRDERDEDPRTVVLVARDHAGTVVGGVRLGPVGDGTDIGWWTGSRLAVDRTARGGRGVGAALVRAACAYAENAGALRFEATVQARNEILFTRLGWHPIRAATVAGTPHVLMRWPIGRIAVLAAITKSHLGPLLRPLRLDEHPAATPSGGGVGEAGGGWPGSTLGGPGFVGDDGAPVPGTDLIAACDAIMPTMVERDPHWAGWCAVLVNLNDLAAMGAHPIGVLDALAARDTAHAARILDGLRAGATAYAVPILGGHTQLGVPAALTVTALGRTTRPIPAAGGRPGHRIRLTTDLAGRWRSGYHGRQWDCTTTRRTSELRTMLAAVGTAHPAAAKDVSMAGIAGTLGMLAEASGCAAILDPAAVPRPAIASMGDWLTCFPGFGMLTADEPGRPDLPAGPAVGAECGELTAGHGVWLRWPDGECTEAIPGVVTGLGRA